MSIKRKMLDPPECLFTRHKGRNRNEWLKLRSTGIGGSDAASTIGQNPWKTSEQLWEEKTGLYHPEDISNKPAVKYGTEAEKPLRELFALDHPDMQVYYSANEVLRNNEYQWQQASLDGELIDAEGRRGVLEIKTTTIMNGSQWDSWNDKVPDNYFVQVLHCLLVTGYEFAILKAQIKSDDRIFVRHYSFERENYKDSLEYLMKKEIEFWKYVEDNQRPPLILPSL